MRFTCLKKIFGCVFFGFLEMFLIKIETDKKYFKYIFFVGLLSTHTKKETLNNVQNKKISWDL